MPEPAARPVSSRALIAFAIIGALGFGGGAVANQGVARLLALPEDAVLPEYVDAEVADTRPTDEGTADEAGKPTSRKPRALTVKQYADIIVRRNIFDSTAVYEESSQENTNPNGECRSDANVRLLATVVADLPDYSSALISIGSGKEGRADGYKIGDDIGGEGKITVIEQKRVCLASGTCVCIGGDDKKPGAVAPKTEGGEEGGVNKISDTKFEIDQSVIDGAMGDFEKLATQVRVTPHKGADGEIDGYRLSAIRKGSLFEKLGIKNGDIVHGVNGNTLTSTEAAMGVYNTLKNEKSFTFDISRRNQRQTMEYSVR